MRKTKPKPTSTPKTQSSPVSFIIPKRDSSLTQRELEVLKLFAHGQTYPGIGEELGISSKTVGSYLQRIREKCRAKNRADLVKLAKSEKLIG